MLSVYEFNIIQGLLESVQDGNIQEIVVAHKDRLARFGTALFEWIATRADACIIYEDNHCLSSEQELAADLLAIVHVFSCRANGKRRYGKVNIGGKERDVGIVQGQVDRRENDAQVGTGCNQTKACDASAASEASAR